MPSEFDDKLEKNLKQLFGVDISIKPLAKPARTGRRIFGIDLVKSLSAAQAEFMVSLLDRYKVLTLPDQDQAALPGKTFQSLWRTNSSSKKLRQLHRLPETQGTP